MNIGLFTPVFNQLGFEAMLEQVARYPQITSLEIGTGGWPGNAHLDMEALLASAAAARAYRQRLADAGLRISALSCHANVVHPVAAIAARDTEQFHKTLRLANVLEVDTVVRSRGVRAFGEGRDAELDYGGVAAGVSGGAAVAVGRAADSLLARGG